MSELMFMAFGLGFFCGIVTTISVTVVYVVFDRNKKDADKMEKLVKKASRPWAHYLGEESK